MQIVGVMLFEGALDFARLQSCIERRMLSFPRFRQIVRQEGGVCYWENDPEFNLDHHLHRAVLPGAAGKAELELFVADLACIPLNPSRPLWAFHLVDTALGGQALVMRIHHCIADGIALVSVILSMADESTPVSELSIRPSEIEPEDDFFSHTIWRPVTETMLASINISGKIWNKYLGLLANPWKAVDYARVGSAIAAEIGKLAIMPNDSPTRFKGKPGTTKRVA